MVYSDAHTKEQLEVVTIPVSQLTGIYAGSPNISLRVLGHLERCSGNRVDLSGWLATCILGFRRCRPGDLPDDCLETEEPNRDMYEIKNI